MYSHSTTQLSCSEDPCSTSCTSCLDLSPNTTASKYGKDITG